MFIVTAQCSRHTLSISHSHSTVHTYSRAPKLNKYFKIKIMRCEIKAIELFKTISLHYGYDFVA